MPYPRAKRRGSGFLSPAFKRSRYGRRVRRSPFFGLAAGAISLGGAAVSRWYHRGSGSSIQGSSGSTTGRRTRARRCATAKSDPVQKSKTHTFETHAASDYAVHSTGDSSALIAQIGLGQIPTANLGLNANHGLDPTGMINSSVTPGWHQMETPQWWTYFKGLFKHYVVNWIKFKYEFENHGNTPINLYWMVVRPHGDEDTSLSYGAGVRTEAFETFLQHTTGVKCLTIPGKDQASMLPGRASVSCYMNRKKLVNKADWYLFNNTLWRRETDEVTATIIDDHIPHFKLWAFNAINPATTIPVTTLLMHKFDCKINVRFFGRFNPTVESRVGVLGPDA